MYKAIIVDDEVKACEVLKSFVQELDVDITVTHSINTPLTAVKIIEQNEPDILFLDVNMPHMNGFDILQALSSPSFEIIFVTGHDEYAINAIRFAASGYILKPIDIDELTAAVHKSTERLIAKKSLIQNKTLLHNVMNIQTKRIGIPTMAGLDFVIITDIIRCEAVLKCTKLFTTGDRPIISSYNIGEFVKLLSPYNFFATHKSHLINLDKISHYHREGTIKMTDGSIVPVARRRKQDFLNMIQKL